MDVVAHYQTTVFPLGALAFLVLIQFAVLDFVMIRSRHTPGTPIEGDHASLLFRVSRAYANTNESLPLFLLIILVALIAGMEAETLGTLLWWYCGARLIHMLAYYGNLKILRSIGFGLSLTLLVIILVKSFTT